MCWAAGVYTRQGRGWIANRNAGRTQGRQEEKASTLSVVHRGVVWNRLQGATHRSLSGQLANNVGRVTKTILPPNGGGREQQGVNTDVIFIACSEHKSNRM